SGTFHTVGTYMFTLQVTDSTSATASQQFSISIAVGLTISTASVLPGGTAGAAYSQTLAATGGVPPYIWSVSAGAPPPGLSLSSAGVLSGTPSSGGSYAFTAT